MSVRVLRPAIFCASLALCSALASPAFAGWSADPTLILGSGTNLRPLAACSDGAYGTYVFWHEEQPASANGVLIAHHVLASGDVDPAWSSTGIELCDAIVSRAALGAVSDGLGGAYVWWMEGSQIYLTRLAPNGERAVEWPARGRMLGALDATYGARPSVISDGAHGIYLAWAAAGLSPAVSVMRAIHLGPDNLGAGGWPNSLRALSGPVIDVTIDAWPQITLAPDGGLMLAWARANAENVWDEPGAFKLARFTSAGIRSPGWPATGVSIAPFLYDFSWPLGPASLVALSPDARGGVFFLAGEFTAIGPPPEFGNLETRLYRRLADGTTAPDWPEDGRVISGGPETYYQNSAGASYGVVPDGTDGAFAGFPQYSVHTAAFGYQRMGAEGSYSPFDGADGNISHHLTVTKDGGGAWFASFQPDGPYQMYQEYAHLYVSQMPKPSAWNDFFEYHFEPVVHWYGDAAMASTRDGALIFFWSQANVLHGLYARRFNPAGQSVAVEPGVAPVAALSGLRFISGEGVRARISLADEARLDLFDVSGRRVASRRFEGAERGASDVTIPGTDALPSGLYFARLATGREVFRGRVAVAR